MVLGDYAYIPISQGYYATIDADNVRLVEGFSWSAVVRKHTVYVMRRTIVPVPKTILLHRVIMGDTDAPIVDHRDGDGLNNVRANLRPATKSQNNRNQRMTDRNTSGFKGVSWHKKDRKWRACIHVNNRYIHLGNFDPPEAASTAYVEASARMHHEFGRIE